MCKQTGCLASLSQHPATRPSTFTIQKLLTVPFYVVYKVKFSFVQRSCLFAYCDQMWWVVGMKNIYYGVNCRQFSKCVVSVMPSCCNSSPTVSFHEPVPSTIRNTGVMISPQPDQEGNKLMFLSEWRQFPSASCTLQEKNNVMTARVSMFLKSRASLTYFRACLPSWSG